MFFMPRQTMVCEKVFQDEGVVADVTLAEYPLDFIPFDSDILTLELDSAYKVLQQQTISNRDCIATSVDCHANTVYNVHVLAKHAKCLQLSSHSPIFMSRFV